MKLRAYLLMLFVVAVWGSTFVLIKGALAHATPAAFNLARMTLAFAVMAVGYHRYWRGIRLWQIAAGAVVGLCLATGYQFQTLGLARTTPSKSAFITGLLVVLVPLIVAVVPITRLLPAFYRWRIRSRIYRWYGALMRIEREIQLHPQPEERAALVARVDEIAQAVRDLRTPASFGDQLYVLRDHVAAVRRRVHDGQAGNALAV